MIRPLPRADLWLTIALAAGCKGFEAEPLPQRFDIAGAHAQLVCESCHTEGKPYQPLDTDCRSCHEADRSTPTHFPDQTCNDAGCHTSADLSWADVVGGVDFHDEFLPLEGSHDLECKSCHADLETYTDLPGEADYCWNCHEADRDDDGETTNGLHYIAYVGGDPKQGPDPRFRWDCGPCHTPLTWEDAAFEHPTRTPHGSMITDPKGVEVCVLQPDPADWVFDCADCHPESTATSQCVSCHDDPGHFPGSAPSTCIDAACHASAQPEDCDSLTTPLQ